MKKMMRWYLVLFLLAAVCVLGAWIVSSRSKEPTNATLVWNSPDSREQNIPESPGWNIGADAGMQNYELEFMTTGKQGWKPERGNDEYVRNIVSEN